MSAMGKCSLMVSVSLRFMQGFNCSWKHFYTRVFLIVCSLTERREREIRIECCYLSFSIYDLMFAYEGEFCSDVHCLWS
jgi:hypothetical protein